MSVVVGLAMDVFFTFRKLVGKKELSRTHKQRIFVGLLTTLHVENGWVGPYDLDPASLKKNGH